MIVMKFRLIQMMTSYGFVFLVMNDKAESKKRDKRKTGIILFAGYSVLLLCSYLFQMIPPSHFRSDGSHPEMWVREVVHNKITSQEIRINYIDSDPVNSAKKPVILLLHGNPMPGSRIFKAFHKKLTPFGRVIIPDLPGFGLSDQPITDYSIEAQAVHIKQLLDGLSIEQCHMVAYSMGGAVALSLSHAIPDRVTSLTMISSVGVQELELLGNYYVNHALYGLQLFGIKLLTYGVPHFGWMDDALLNISYARMFYDSDQRPIRGYLKSFKAPMLILQGKKDIFVPVAAAKEHHRIVPQSVLKFTDGGHLMLLSRHKTVLKDIQDFILKVEQKKAPYYKDASTARLIKAEAPFGDITFSPLTGLALMIMLIIISLSTFVSEDLACIGAGMMAAKGIIGFFPAVAASFVGIVVGDILLFLAGKYIGRLGMKYPPVSWWVKKEDLDRYSTWFDHKGPRIIIASRFIPGSRFLTYFTAGILGTRLKLFIVYFCIASLLWTPSLVGLSTLFGTQLIQFYHLINFWGGWTIILAILLFWVCFRLILSLFSLKGRRLLLSSYRRKTRYEFWPTWVFYFPIAIYVIYLSIRNGSLTIFTAVNPGIPLSGFIGESKSKVLKQLAKSGWLANFLKVPSTLGRTRQLDGVRSFMDDFSLDYPIVIKPDIGQRGAGVRIIRSDEDLNETLRSMDGDIIAQEYIEGPEYGVFYYRYPGEVRGKILSITDKRMLTLTGDGKRTLEELILMDDRAVCMAEFHLRTHRHRIALVPEKGDAVKLVEIGTHSKGSLFLNGNHLITPELERAFDAISHHLNGFYLGRYDIRARSTKDFMKGQHIKVLELNGVTAEAAHIYDPATSIFEAYRVLFNQWKIACEIGGLNRDRGVVPDSIITVVRSLAVGRALTSKG